MLERSLELHISIARNGVRPVLPRRGLNPAALRVSGGRYRVKLHVKSNRILRYLIIQPGLTPRRGRSGLLSAVAINP